MELLGLFALTLFLLLLARRKHQQFTISERLYMTENNTQSAECLSRLTAELESVFDKDIIELLEARLTNKGKAEVVNLRLNDFVKKSLIDKAISNLKEKIAVDDKPNALEFIGVLALMHSAYLR